MAQRKETAAVRHGAEEIILAEYEVFPGVRVVEKQVRARGHSEIERTGGEMLWIHYCRDGWLECEFDRHFFCLPASCMAVVRTAGQKKRLYMPSGCYEGVSVVLDLTRANEGNAEVRTRVAALLERFIGTGCYVAPAAEDLEPVLSELFEALSVGDQAGLEKPVLVLLRRLCGDESLWEKPGSGKRHIELARQVCTVLEERVDTHVSIEELAELFQVSPTQVKKCFHNVYGVSVYSYSRILRMQSAARMLRQTDQRILDIAQAHGYANASKFAKAFQDVFGMTPKDFRRLSR